jgi:hypothetical protein
MKIFEKIVGLLGLLALILKFNHLPGGSVLFVLSLGTLATFYIYLSFALFNNLKLKDLFKKETYLGISKYRIIGSVITGFSLSMLLVGILFSIQHWPGAIFNLASGLVVAFIIFLVAFLKHLKNNTYFYKNILLRLSIFGGIGLTLLILNWNLVR